MPPKEAPRALSQSLGAYSVRDLDRLNHASELLAATANGIDRLSSPASAPLRQLIYEANQEILAVMKKPAAAFQRWHQRNTPAVIETDNG